MSAYEQNESGRAAPDDNEVDGDHERFVLLFSSERKRLYGYIYSLVPIPADAEDIFQQVSLVLWRKFSEYDETKSFFSWACGIAFNHVRNYRRSAYRRRVCFSEELIEQLAEDQAALFHREPEREEFLRECLALITNRDRDLLSGIYRDGKPVKELAEATGRNPSTVYNRLSQIRKRLFDCINTKMAFRRQQA